MDHHLKFRFESMNQASSSLGQRQPTRLPMSSASTPKLFRSKCKPMPLDAKTAPENSEPTQPSLSERIRRHRGNASDGPQVQKQVKQLQFWLKVFSRFCHDPGAAE